MGRFATEMADRMWGGVPFTIPSKTAMKYLSGALKAKREAALPSGGKYNARQTMDRELPGHRQTRNEMLESYENYDKQRWRAKTEPKQDRRSVVSATREFQSSKYKPGAGIGWTEPRNEAALGLVDRRRHLPGYIGGVKIRDSIFKSETRF